MGRKRTAKFPKPSQPDDEARQALESGSKPARMTKTAAAHAAIREGVESPMKAVEYIRKQFGIEMGRQHFSAVKSQMRNRDRKAGSAPKKRGRKPRGLVAHPQPSKQAVRREADVLGAMEAMKPLVAALGSAKVKRIVDLLG